MTDPALSLRLSVNGAADLVRALRGNMRQLEALLRAADDGEAVAWHRPLGVVRSADLPRARTLLAASKFKLLAAQGRMARHLRAEDNP